MAMLASCSDSEPGYVLPDNYTDKIQFSVSGVNETVGTPTRTSDSGYEAYDQLKHASTLGVFGWHSSYAEDNMIFSNKTLTLQDEKWAYEPVKYWREYERSNAFEFYGYMYESELPEATLTNDGEKTMLSFPVTLSAPVLDSPDKTPLICTAAIQNRGMLNAPMEFKMDQTLTGYSVWFMLGEQMDDVRDFVVKSVSVSGTFPTSGVVSRSYSNGGADDIRWSALAGNETITDHAIAWPDNTLTDTLTVTGEDYLKWGEAFYAIPSESFEPTIKVTYDVVLNSHVVTRKNVTNTIVLNKANFKNLATGATGRVNKIQIKIVPTYLGVLADKDQATGFLVITE